MSEHGVWKGLERIKIRIANQTRKKMSEHGVWKGLKRIKIRTARCWNLPCEMSDDKLKVSEEVQ